MNLKYKQTREFLIYFILILIISVVFSLLCKNNKHILFSKDIAATVISAILGYSFTALFFLMALPRTGFIEKIEQDRSLTFYGLIIAMPALTGVFQLVLDPLNITYGINLLLFFMSILWFLVSILFIFLIMFRYRTFKRDIHKSL